MFVFSKKLKLLTTKHFNRVFKRQLRISYSKIIIFGCMNKLGYPRIGFNIAKKNVKLAHERNRIKRLIREYFRLHQHELPSMDFIILVRKGIDNLNNKKITEILCKLWCHKCRIVQNY
ncbi:MAG: ribonuclease P protein component [Arsenophonus endosymbiont of Ceratovacuna japonica]